MTINHGKADSAEFVADENGWELHVVDEGGDTHVFNVHAITSALLPIAYPLVKYWTEGMAAAATYVPPVTQDDLDAYEVGDPKRVALENS